MEQTIERQFAELKAALAEIWAQLAWRELQRDERCKSGLPLRFEETSPTELELEAGRFWRLSAALDDGLAGLPPSAQRAWRNRLSGIREVARQLTSETTERLL